MISKLEINWLRVEEQRNNDYLSNSINAMMDLEGSIDAFRLIFVIRACCEAMSDSSRLDRVEVLCARCKL